MTNLHDPLLTIDEAADLLGTGPSLPLRLIASGRLDHTGEGDEVRIPQSALIAYASGTQDDGTPDLSAPCGATGSATTTEHHAA